MRVPRASGFTLLEVLVVVTLVGILGAAVTLALSARGDRALEASAENLRDALNHAAESAVISGRAYGLYVTPAGYSTAVFDGRGWQSIDAGQAAFAPPYRLRGNGVYAVRRQSVPAPQAVFLPDGTHQVGDITIENTLSGEAWAVESLGAGRYGAARRAEPR